MGDERAQLAAVYQQVRQLQDQGRNEEGLSLALRLLEPSQRILGPQHPEVAEVHATIGILARRTGRSELAIEHQQRALEIRIRCFGESHLSVAASLSNLGTVYMEARNFSEAEGCYRNALAIREQSPDAEALAVAFTRSNLASAVFAQGRQSEAEQMLLQAVADWQRTDAEDWRSVEILSNLARTYRLTRRHADALPLLERVIDVASRVLPPGNYLWLEQRKQLGLCLSELGHFEEAVAVLADVAESYRMQFGADDDRAIVALINLAEANSRAGALDHAEAAAQRALERVRPRSLPHGNALNQLGSIHRQMDRLTQATSEYEEAAEILEECVGPEAPLLGVVLSNLASLHRQQGEYGLAGPKFERAIAILRSAQHEMLPLTLNNYGVLALETGDHSKAEHLWRECIDLYHRHPSPYHDIRMAKLLNNLGELLRDQHRFEEAEPLLRQAVDRHRQLLGATHPETVTGLFNLSHLCIATGRREEGFRLLIEANTVSEQTLHQVFARSSMSQRREYFDQLLTSYYAVLSLAMSLLPDSPESAKAAFELVLRRKGLQAEAILAHYRSATSDSAQGILGQLFQVSAELSRVALTRANATDEHAETALRAERDQLEALLAQETGGGGLESTLAAVSLDAVASALPPAGALVEYVRFPMRDFDFSPWSRQAWGSERYAAFILPQADARVQLVDLGPADPIDDLLNEFRYAVARGGEGVYGMEHGPDRDEVDQLGQRLRAAVFDPVAVHLPALGEQGRPLIVVPDGNLTKLPFAVLPTVRGTHLVDDYVISFLPSGRKLLAYRPEVPAGTSLVIAAPDFDLGLGVPQTSEPTADLDLDDKSFPPLPSSKAEGTLIADLLGVAPFLGAAATGDTLISARSPRIIHLATHAFFLPDEHRHLDPRVGGFGMEAEPDGTTWVVVGRAGDETFGAGGVLRTGPLGRLGQRDAMYRSGLAFAGSNAWLRDGQLTTGNDVAVLTADRIAGLDLRATNLIVLSACETGLGDVQRAEGVLGLRWACAVAGAHSLLMSLWKIPDDETRQLMESFYRAVLKGIPRAAALRVAQIERRAIHPDPYFWGAFVLEGDAGPLA
jgi:CHAT domain-containing protein